jgi:3-methyladenine DNA glycosylase/8-oxoguanine DNA glycosylase
MNILLPARPPFNFHSVIHSHGWYQLLPMEWDAQSRTLNVVTQLGSGRVLALSLSGNSHGVEVQLKAQLRKDEANEVAAKVMWMFGLDLDFTAFYALADEEPRLAHVRSQAMGRWLRSPSLWEDVVKVMMTTNIQWGGTKRLVAAIVNQFGEPLANDSERKAFPSPAAIARRDESTLRGLGLGYRASYLLRLAKDVASGKTDLNALKDGTRSTDDVRRDLLKLPGLGPYAAATLLGLLARYDFIGVDSEAVKLVSQGFYGGKPIGEKEVNAVFARWGQYKSLAYWFWDWDGQQQTPMEAWEAKKSLESI